MIGCRQMKRRTKKKPVISLTNVTKTYTLRHEKPTFVEGLLSGNHSELHTALDSISLDIYAGDRIGIVGRNGSGKTTLLKLFSLITKPQSGEVKVTGNVVSLIDLAAGFHPDLTGEENIVLQGLIIGMTLDEIKAKKKKIIEFAEIGKFIDAPIYTYSSGMTLRLGFSIAFHSEPDILLLDESFAVGDESFRRKIKKKFDTLKNSGKTLIMVSHWIDELVKYCDKFLWLEDGRMIAYGGIEVMKKYKKSFEKK